jgi:hypothetical protein
VAQGEWVMQVTAGRRAMTSELTVHSEVRGDAVVLRFDGDVDLMTVAVVNQSITTALEQGPGHRLAGDRTVFRVVAPTRATSRPLEMVGLTTVFDVFPTLDDALASPEQE